MLHFTGKSLTLSERQSKKLADEEGRAVSNQIPKTELRKSENWISNHQVDTNMTPNES